MKKYDLEERTARFSEEVIAFSKDLQRSSVNDPLITQLVRSSTSIGANYYEANQASSKRDFQNKIYICKKESSETKYWLRLVAKAQPQKSEICRKLWKEAHELNLIFSKIVSSSRKGV